MKNLGIPKWIDLLVFLYNRPLEQCYSQRIQKGMDITSSHARKLLKLMETAGLVYRVKTRKIQYITLTPRGRQVAEMLMIIKREVEIHEICYTGE